MTRKWRTRFRTRNRPPARMQWLRPGLGSQLAVGAGQQGAPCAQPLPERGEPVFAQAHVQGPAAGGALRQRAAQPPDGAQVQGATVWVWLALGDEAEGAGANCVQATEIGVSSATLLPNGTSNRNTSWKAHLPSQRCLSIN